MNGTEILAVTLIFPHFGDVRIVIAADLRI